jgi:hypothetical protein
MAPVTHAIESEVSIQEGLSYATMLGVYKVRSCRKYSLEACVTYVFRHFGHRVK